MAIRNIEVKRRAVSVIRIHRYEPDSELQPRLNSGIHIRHTQRELADAYPASRNGNDQARSKNAS